MIIDAPPHTSREVALIRYPSGLPRAEDFATRDCEIRAIEPGEVLIRMRWISLDPAMRTWSSQNPGRGEPLPLGSVMRAYGVGEVVISENPDYPLGTRVAGPFGMRSWHITDGSDVRRVVPAELEPIHTALGVVGHVGLTAYIGLHRVAELRSTDTVVVTSAAGAVGSLAAQIARLEGCSVVGIAGGDKVEWASRTYGIDTVLDRRDPDLAHSLARATPDGVDVFFDNTGGPVHDLVMQRMNMGGRVAICGTVALDSAQPGTGPRHERLILDRALRISGFLQSHHDHESQAALAELQGLFEAGLLRLEYDVIDGLDHAIEGLERLLAGDHLGKMIVSVEGDVSVESGTDA